MGYLIDTNVLAEVRKRERGNPQVQAWMKSVRSSDLYLSVLVIGEVRAGIERLRRRDTAGAAALETWLSQIEKGYGARILPVSREIAEAWGHMTVPDPLPVIDGLLAATAKVQGLTLVTRNTKDVVRTGVSLLNPFE
ncbi:MAG: type II toxin-antitoxin system VapC family toxin [Polyangiaceae bacterium]|nr:type II toxin-antitoxin system VapC family toxin [Polyangiaceae bacterium]